MDQRWDYNYGCFILCNLARALSRPALPAACARAAIRRERQDRHGLSAPPRPIETGVAAQVVGV